MISSFGFFVVLLPTLYCGLSAMAVPVPDPLYEVTDLLEQQGRFMLFNMNLSADPCEDFYEFACGNWKNNSMVPALNRNGNFIQTMQDKTNELITKFLKEPPATGEENTDEGKAKRFFASCMDVNISANQHQGFKLKETVMLYKFLDLKQDGKLDWIELNFFLQNHITPLLPVSLRYNQETLTYDIFISPPKPLARIYHRDTLQIESRYLSEEFNETLRFEDQLLATVKELNEPIVQSLEDFINTHNSAGIDWARIFQLAFNRTINHSWIVHNEVSSFSDLNNFLKNSNTDLIFTYVKWVNYANVYASRLPNITETIIESIIENKCREKTIQYMFDGILPWYKKTVTDKDRQADVLELSEHLKKTFYSFLENNSWLDNDKRLAAKAKLRAMDVLLTDSGRNVTPRCRYPNLSTVKIIDNYWVNIMNLEQNRAIEMSKAIGTSCVKLYHTDDEVVMSYHSYLNAVFAAFAIIQLPLYDINMPYSLKFGGIGASIGQQIAHGFVSLSDFQCLQSQYNELVLNGLGMDGDKTFEDNFADNTGTRAAYHSYLRFLSENPSAEKGDDKPLPGVDFTNKQLFFLKFSQMWCNGQSLEERIDNSIHYKNDKLRVLATLRNMAEFSEEFQCAPGSEMNPPKKCVIWK